MIFAVMKEQLHSLFAEKFDTETLNDLQVFFCPGRVNLLGEHTDYNGGWVLPAAISMGIYAIVQPRSDYKVCLASTLFEQRIILNTKDTITYNENDAWANYPKGVMQQLQSKGVRLQGCDILFVNDLPLGSGLSSSAALEVLTAYVFLNLAGIPIDEPKRVEIAQLAQAAENTFVGVNCGIMDMFAVALGKTQQAIQLHCDSLEYKQLPLNLGSYQLVIINTNKPRKLVESKYNERQAECQQALKLIAQHVAVANLSEVTLEQIETYITDPVIAKRARHVVSENQRVKQAGKYLENEQIAAFGELMDASHQSLKADYEVSGIELDTAVATARQLPGCIGARMTGAGFGGCALALVHHDSVNSFTEQLIRRYTEVVGYKPDCYPVIIKDGVKKL